ncbi:UBX domain-containing protein 6 [Prorops nasuta]|uniref:UBX domain-containing protein 6 n=1 Tax=Prorops nasuta TaxID=863751 RepID=UPI0034CFA28B
MADKIKSFFQKKKTNAKFMNAGKGYKLTDNTSSTSKGKPKEPIKRAEPTEEAKVAGQAALARLEAKQKDITKINTSYAAIQARVKKELEQERKARELLEKEHSESKENIKEISKVEDNSTLAVAGVFFRCPTISDEVLTWDEWKKKIKEFLYEQLTQEEAGLTSCLIIHNCNSGKEKIENCVETLGKYLDNILSNPDIEKYWKIRMSNKIFQEKVLPLEGSLDFLQAAGFEKTKLMHNESEEDFLVWNKEKCDVENLTMLADALRSAEPIPIDLDRALQILLPSQANEKSKLPASFFTMTPEEIKKEQQLRTEALEKSQMLRTKAMREKDEQREMKKYRFTLIRIKFPDSIILQGTFSVHEKLENVLTFVKENLIDSQSPFYLLTPTRQKLTKDCEDKTLLDLKLVPAVHLSFFWDGDTVKNPIQGYLKEEVLCFIQNS